MIRFIHTLRPKEIALIRYHLCPELIKLNSFVLFDLSADYLYPVASSQLFVKAYSIG